MLGTVHLTKKVMADGKPLAPGTYQVRLTSDAPKPAIGETPNAEKYVEFLRSGKVVVEDELVAGAQADVVAPDLIAATDGVDESNPQAVRRDGCFGHVGGDDLVGALRDLPVQSAGIVDVDKAESARKVCRPGGFEVQRSLTCAGRELPPGPVRALDQQRVARGRPVERPHRAGVEELARETALVDHP